MTQEQTTVQPDEHTQTAQTDQQEVPAGDDARRMVPVTEAIRYRKRAQAAEQQLDELSSQTRQLQAELDEARQTTTQLERRQTINELLAESQAVDLEVARLLTETAVESMSKPDVKLAIEDLRRTKPYLFRRSTGDGSSVMSSHVPEADHLSTRAAQDAAATGDRRDLLRYLRLRRQARPV